jgi:endonuclease/exonuclease/phosphatase (EEP) superfamily protein YafD
MIVAGDFNSWSQSRLSVLEEILVEKRLMHRVAFSDQNPRAIFGYTVDHVYYRGLTVIDGRVLESDTSDHAPIWVLFGQAGESAL